MLLGNTFGCVKRLLTYGKRLTLDQGIFVWFHGHVRHDSSLPLYSPLSLNLFFMREGGEMVGGDGRVDSRFKTLPTP